jgi:ribulose 1,5-bisphosphate carboxylase large subunit-like protein
MTNIEKAGTFTLGTRTVNRLGYGAMQLAGPGVFGPPKDRAAAVAVLRAAVEAGRRTTSTPATSTARTSPTRSFARRCIRTATT